MPSFRWRLTVSLLLQFNVALSRRPYPISLSRLSPLILLFSSGSLSSFLWLFPFVSVLKRSYSGRRRTCFRSSLQQKSVALRVRLSLLCLSAEGAPRQKTEGKQKKNTYTLDSEFRCRWEEKRGGKGEQQREKEDEEVERRFEKMNYFVTLHFLIIHFS